MKLTSLMVSWTKVDDLNKIYWFRQKCPSKYLEIEYTMSSDEYGIDINGLEEWLGIYVFDDFMFHTPATQAEQEIVFPIKKGIKTRILKK